MIAATTMVAGLLADFMTDDLSPADAQLKLHSIARPRVGGGRNVMYNGEQTPRVLVPASSWTEDFLANLRLELGRTNLTQSILGG